MSTPRKRDPIKKITLASGAIRYRFVVDVAGPGEPRVQKTFTYDTSKQARAERARIISEVAAGRYVRPDRALTVAAYLGEWLAGKATKKASTQRSYADAIKPVVDRHGELPLQKLTTAHLEAIREGMRTGELRRVGKAGEPLSARSVNLTLGVMAMALGRAVKRGLLERNVADLVDRAPAAPAAGTARDGWQTEDAVAFLRSVQDDRLYAAWLLSLLGLRRGEVLGLHWSDIDLAGEHAKARRFAEGTPTLTIRNNRTVVAGIRDPLEGTPKARASARTLPLPPVVVAALRALRSVQAAERLAAGEAYDSSSGKVVVNEQGKPPRPEWFSDRFLTLSKRAGLPRLPLHGARHCAASLLGALGLPAVATAAWLGQAQVSVTHLYQHAQRAQLEEASKALGDMLAGNM